MKATDMLRTPMNRWFGLIAGLLCIQAMPAWAAMNVLNSISVTQGQGDSQVVKIAFKDALDAMPVAFSTSNPNRLVLDFANTANAAGRAPETLSAGIVKDYQGVQSGDRTRLVFNLSAPASHEVRKEKNLLLIVLNGTAVQAATPAPVQFPDVSAKRDHGVRDVEFRRGPNGESRVAVTLSAPGVGVDIQQKGKALQVDFLSTSLPTSLQRRMDVSDFATPAQTIETFEQGKTTRMLINPKGRWDYSAWQTGNQFVVEVRSLDEPQSGAKSDKPVYSGEKLSLTFQNVDVRAVLQVIADFTSLNIIASDTVTGSVTLRLKDVPWDQALDIILRAKGLDKRSTGNVIWVAPRDELAAKEKMELEAKKAVADLEPLVTKNYPLNYVRADEAMQVLSGGSRAGAQAGDEATCTPSASGIRADTAAGAAGGSSSTTQTTTAGGQHSSTTTNVNRVLSHRGGAAFDLKTNTLVVTDTAEKQMAVQDVLKGIDVPTKQVMIEARIVIADDSFGRNLGAKLGLNTRIDSGATSVGIAGNASDSRTTATTGPTAPSANSFNVNLPANPATGTAGSLGFTVFNAASNLLLSLELQALEADNRGKIVSNPRVVTTNLRPAVILQGQQIPYQTDTAGSSQAATVSFKDALLCLLVSPQILNNDAVILNVEVTKDAAGKALNGGVPIDVKRVKTQVRVNNGETAVLGGIFEQSTRDDTSKVPVLGDIPVLGNLFKTNARSDAKSEMLIFLTPKVLDERIMSQR